MKAKTITEIHTEAEKNMKLRPGSTASIRSSRAMAAGVLGNISPVVFPMNRPGTGGMMPGMPGTRRMPGIDNDNWEVPRSRSMPRGEGVPNQPVVCVQPALIGKSPSLNQRLLPQGSGGLISGRSSALLQGSGAPLVRSPSFGVDPVSQAPAPAPARPVPTVSVAPATEKPLAPAAKSNTEELKRITKSLLEEYFSVRILDEALQCVEELKSPGYHPEFVEEAINLALEKSPPCVEPVMELLEHLYSKKVITKEDLRTGCVLYGSLLDDIGLDLPKAPNNFGEIMGRLVLGGELDFKVVEEVLKKMEDDFLRKDIFPAVMRIVGSSSSGQKILDSQAADIAACQSLF